jgi:SNF2 family DNA or RNA helicase
MCDLHDADLHDSYLHDAGNDMPETICRRRYAGDDMEVGSVTADVSQQLRLAPFLSPEDAGAERGGEPTVAGRRRAAPAGGRRALAPVSPGVGPAPAAARRRSDAELLEALLARVVAGVPVSSDRSRLVEAAIGVWSRPGFDALASLAGLRFEPYEHQLRAASAVLAQMGARAILADEVGLGKTIEAGIVLAELQLRGLARRVLVLTPTGLVEQWREELERKFAIPTVVAGRDGWGEPAAPANGTPVLLAPLATARRSALRARLTAEAWDLVVVDEAHRVRNPRTASAGLVRELRSRFLLLLTATPVENRVEDLYHLVSLVRPGHLGTLGEFRRRHAAGREAGEGGAVGALPELRKSLREVMVRHRRSELTLMLPRRLAETVLVRPGSDERELYRRVSNRVRSRARGAAPAAALSLRAVQQLAGSTPGALVRTLEKVGWEDLAAEARSVRSCSKTAALVGLLERHHLAGEKVIVFTGYRETLAHLAGAVAELGLDAAVYHGALSRREKDAAIARFETEADVLLSTESAGEGRNLQFCHAMINFDLPWNPMRIEQRVGRLHRIGQLHDVVLTNLVGAATIEEQILDVLHAKLNLFELVVGELDMILGRLGEEFAFEDAVFAAHVESADDAERARRIGELGGELVQARAEHAASRARTDELVGEGGGAPPPPTARTVGVGRP